MGFLVKPHPEIAFAKRKMQGGVGTHMIPTPAPTTQVPGTQTGSLRI